MDDLEAMGPPEGWLDKIEEHAENAVESAIGSGNKQNVGKGGYV